MRIYYNRQILEAPLSGCTPFNTVVTEVSKVVNQPQEKIVLYSINNKPLSSPDCAKINDDFALIVYDMGRVVMDGLNKEGICGNKDCQMYGRYVMENCGFIDCERVFMGCTGKCPLCSNSFEVSKIFLKNCHFSYILLSPGKEPVRSNEIDAVDILPEDYDVHFDPMMEYDFSVQRMDHYVCKVCHREITGDHTCESVHRYSIHNDCNEENYYVCCIKQCTYHILTN